MSKIANASSLLPGPHAERRVRRLVHGNNQRAPLSVAALTERLTHEGAKKLAWEDEVLLILDESDLRKPFASSMEHLDTVRSLDGELIPGFRTLNVLGIGASGQRAILYHHISHRTRLRERGGRVHAGDGQGHERFAGCRRGPFAIGHRPSWG